MSVSARRILSVFLAFVLLVVMTGNCYLNIAKATSTNLLTNGGFEEFDGGSFTDWSLWKGNHGETTIEQVDGRTGKAAKVTVNNNGGIVNLYQGITLDADSEYTFTAWVKIENIVRQWETAPGVYLSLSYNNNISIIKSDAINTDTDWQKIEVTVDGGSLQGDEWAVQFDLVAEYVKGDIYIDDAYLEKTENSSSEETTDTNELLKNNGFEEYSDNAFTDWNIWRGNQGNTTLEQADGRTGKAAKITVDNNNNTVNLYQGITLDPACEYTLTAWVKTENIALQWEGANGVFLNLSYNNNISLAKSELIKSDSDWQKLEITVNSEILQGDEWAVNFDIAAEYLTGVIYVDDVSLKVNQDSGSDENPSTEPDEEDKEDESGDDEETSDSIELLKNNSFETYSDNAFANWTLWPGNHGNTTVEQANGRTDKAAKITVNDDSSIVNLYQGVELEPDCQYIFTVWIKTENIVRQWETAPGVYVNLWCDNAVIAKSETINTDADWQKIEVVVDTSALQGDETDVRFDIAVEYVKGDIYVDDASLKLKEDDSSTDDTDPNPDGEEKEDEEQDNPAEENPEEDNNTEDEDDNSASVELLKNGGFEEYSKGSFASWTLWKGNQGNTTIKQVNGRTGKAAKITVDNNNNTVNLYQGITLDPEYQYTFTAWVKTEDIELQWDGANGVYLSLSYNNNIPLVKSKLIKTDSDWQKLEIVVNGSVLKGDEWAVNFDIAAEYLTGSIYVDDVSLEISGDSSSTEGVTPIPDEEKGEESDSNELLKNKGFEEYSKGDFEYWTLWKGNKGNTKIKQVNGRTGKAAKITVDNDQNIVNLYQEIELDPSLEYTFSVWVKTENIKLQWSGAQGVYLNLSCDNSKVLMSESINTDSGWKKLEVVVNGGVLEGDEWSVRFDIAAEYLTGTVYIDDANIEVTGKATAIAKPDEDELLKNNSFEIFSAGNFAHWIFWKGNKGNTTLEQADGRTGKAAKITVDNNNNIVNLYQEIELDPDCEYTFTAWVKVEDIALQWQGAQGVYLNLNYNNNVVLMSKPITVDSDWQKLELVVNGGILQGDEWGVRFDLASEYMTGVVYIDDVSLKVTGKGSPVPKESPDELLKNSSFELYSGYNFAGWGLNRGNRGNTTIEQISQGRNGKAAKITVDDNNNIIALYQNIELDPTLEYTFSIWVKLEDIQLQWEGAQGVYLGFGYNNTIAVTSASIKADTNGWQKLEVVVGGGMLKGDEWGVMFALTAEFLTGTIIVDDASMKVTGKYQAQPDSFLQNGGFDTPDDDTVIENWTAFTEDMFSVLDRNTTMVKDGLASAQIFNSDENVVSTWEQRLENLDTTKEYVLSGYIYSDFIVSENYGAAAFVEFYDPEGHLIKTVRSDYVKGEQTDWTYFELKLAFPENCFTMVVKAALKNAVGTAYFDMFSLVEYEETHTAEEGVFENLFLMEIADDDYDETAENSGGNNITLVLVIVAVSAAVVLLGTGTALFILIRKKRKRMEGDSTV